MRERIRNWLYTHPVAMWVYPIGMMLTVLAFFSASITEGSYIWGFLCVLILLCYAFRPNSSLHSLTTENSGVCRKLFTLLVALVTIAACTLPMDMLPLWNGEVPEHRNQYELMAENILEGRLDFAYGDEDALLELENPYDPDERNQAGVWYHWDHAYYDGHYYMYFGIVPVFLTFLPYRIITGMPLTTYHATQIFTAVSIAGIFVLFSLLAKLFFKKLPYSVYLLLSVAFSVMSIWYAIAEPALYCTAITAAIALEIWSLYFFIRAVWGEQKENRQLLFAGIGALLGALVFGCRPPIAIANLAVIPMLTVFLRQRKFTLKLLGKLVLAALPYVAVAAGLMLYNYARFDDPFEFGQKYQLTVADQSQYSIVFDTETNLRIVNDTLMNLFGIGTLGEEFPYLYPSSVFYNFPILLLLCIGMFQPRVIKTMKRTRLFPLLLGLLAAVLVISAMDILWTPYLLERYRMDIYFLMGIACFAVVGIWYRCSTKKQQKRISGAAAVLSVATICSAYLLCVSTIGVYYLDVVKDIANTLHLS